MSLWAIEKMGKSQLMPLVIPGSLTIHGISVEQTGSGYHILSQSMLSDVDLLQEATQDVCQIWIWLNIRYPKKSDGWSASSF